MQYYKVTTEAGEWHKLTWEQAKAKAEALLALDSGCAILFDGTEPDKPVIQTVERTVYRYVCTVKGCSREFNSKASLAGHLRHHKLRVEVPVIR